MASSNGGDAAAKYSEGKKLPGPAQSCYFGNLLEIEETAHLNYTQWAEEFGPVVGFSLGPMGDAMVISGAHEFEAAYKLGSDNDTNFRDRWRPYVLKKIGYEGSITWENWLPHAKDRKHLLHELLKGLDMEGLFKREVNAVCDVLGKGDDAIDVVDLLNTANNNILLSITVNRSGRFEYTDDEFKKLSEAIVNNNRHSLLGNPINFSHILWYTPMSGAMRRTDRQLRTVLQPYIDSHRESFDKDNIRDLVDGYLGGIGHTSFDVKDAINGTTHLYPSICSLRSAMQWTILLIMSHEDVQKKVHEEIDKVLQDSDDVTDDIVTSKMPYINRVIKESLRLATPVGQILPHCPIKDSNFEGFKVKKDTIMFANIWGPNHDAESWPDPFLFKPDRWLDKEEYPPCFKPFGSGLRMCAGYKIAPIALRIFIVTIFKKFHLKGVEGEKLPTLDDVYMEAGTTHPNHFKVISTIRHKKSSE